MEFGQYLNFVNQTSDKDDSFKKNALISILTRLSFDEIGKLSEIEYNAYLDIAIQDFIKEKDCVSLPNFQDITVIDYMVVEHILEKGVLSYPLFFNHFKKMDVEKIWKDDHYKYAKPLRVFFESRNLVLNKYTDIFDTKKSESKGPSFFSSNMDKFSTVYQMLMLVTEEKPSEIEVVERWNVVKFLQIVSYKIAKMKELEKKNKLKR